MRDAGLKMGEFPDTRIGIFDYKGADFLATSQYFGLTLSETCFLGHVRSKRTGRAIHITRMIISTTSSGLSLSSEGDDGHLYQDPRGEGFMRGGIYARSLNDKGDLVLKCASGFWSGPSDLEVVGRFGDDFSWKDSGLLSLRGRRLGPGTQTYVSYRRGPAAAGVAHTGVFYDVEGEVLGEPVSGCFALEQIFCPPGETLADSVIRQSLVGSWSAFATIFEDGSTQYGNIGYGAGPWRYANIVDGDRHIRAYITGLEVETDSQGLGKRLVYTLDNGERWESVVTMTLMDMLTRARSLGSTVQAHKGYIQRVGETRKRRDWYTIQEWLPERLVDNPPEDIGRELPREF